MQKAKPSELQRRAFGELMKDVGTSVPGHILAFDVQTQLAQVQIGIEGIKKGGERFTRSPLIEVPVYFFGGGYAIECQIDPGLEGIIIFSQRCIDGWVNTGGVATNPILRFNDFSDAMFLPGLRSQPNKLPAFQNNGIRMRDPKGENYIWLKNDGTGEMKMTSLSIDAAMSIKGDIEHDGDQKTTGTITGDTDVVAAGISGSKHTHVYVNTLPDGKPSPVVDTTPPTPAP